ncbi:MAG: AI-2E family transporter [Betaproteobacteria bacterium]|nr:MAG: AI-2E family transporter [Betaproteobacteria bacterium]
MDEQALRALTRRAVLALFLGGLLYLSYEVLRFFLVPVAWAGILAFVTWPVYARLVRLAPDLPNLTALAMTIALAAAFVAPAIWLIAVLRTEASAAYVMLRGEFSLSSLRPPEFVLAIPWLGEQLQAMLERLGNDREALRAEILHWLDPWLGKIGVLAGGVTHVVANMIIALFTVFFFYRDGALLVYQCALVLRRFVGWRAQRYVKAVGDTTKAVVYGIVLTALVQGTLAGLGYWVAGMQAPVLLGAVTALVALIPFGTPFVWGSAGVWLLVTGHTVAGIGLLIWGTLVVSSVDNLIRPLVISTATRIPFLLVMFGVLGGLVAFGPVGLFLGPVVLAVLIGVWQEWLEGGVRPPSRTVAAPDVAPPHESSLPPDQHG